MSKPITLIAQAHQCEEEIARKFCEAVQHCFQGAHILPSFKRIAQPVMQSPQATATEIAALISLLPKELGTQGSGSVRKLSYRLSTGPKRPALPVHRLEPSKAAACPHGIPFYRKSAICHKRAFEEATGLG